MPITPTVSSRPPILLCFAVKEEAAFVSAHGSADRITLITGMGAANAARSVTPVLDRLHPRLVLTCGFAGGLHPGLPVGAVLFDADPESGLTPSLIAAGARGARFHGAERVATTVGEKHALREKTGADAVEMESMVIRQLCRARGIPSATLRVISDAADEDLPLDFNRLMTPEQTLSVGKLMAALAAHPGKIPALIRLQRKTRHAARNLGRILREVMAE